MKHIYLDLWQTRAEHPFPGLTTHAYLLIREAGNVLFYNTGHTDELEHMGELGGVARQYLSHRDEVGPSLTRIRQMFGATLYCHRIEEDAVRGVTPVDVTFESREVHPGGIEVIPTPGHTPGSACFLVKSPHQKTYLFTGDTIYIGDDGSWRNGFLPGTSNKPDLVESLRLLRELEPDVVISSATGGRYPYREVRPGAWKLAVDEALASLL